MPGLTRYRRVALLGALLLGLSLSPWALADDEDTLSIIPGISAMHDNNLFRVPSSRGTSSEDVTITALTLKLNKQYSLQRVELEASYIDYRYKNFSYLSYDAKPYKAAWRWTLTPYLHGNLTSDRATSLNSFADYTGYSQRNIRTTENTRFDGAFDLNQSWHLLAGVSEYTFTNSQVTLGQGNNTVKRAEAGLRYTPSSGSSVSFLTSNGRGEYTNRPQPIAGPSFLDNRFDDRKNELRLLWTLTAKTRIEAGLGYLERNHENFSSRDYSGTVGDVNLNWAISGGASLTAIASRDLASYQTVNTNYTTTDRIALMPLWQISGKTALRARYDYSRRDYLGTPGDFFVASGRKDTLRTAMLALEWLPLRSTTLSATLQNDKRGSNQPGLDYASTMATVSAQIAF